MALSLAEVDASWRPFFSERLEVVNRILEECVSPDLSPQRENVFRAFSTPLDEVKILIMGQDPYPGSGVADGLAFSSPSTPLPPSLINIFKEYSADLGYQPPHSGDLSQWSREGIMLLNRTLTTSIGARNAHLKKGWSQFTFEVASYLASRDTVAILWGNNARELAPLFQYRIESAHPSPLSARRGFFESKPFSRANKILIDRGIPPVNWQL